ncbi:glycoside hydrolase family 43 protein [Paenibacillus alkalitolerans]|uniref:glycoside hydrolase family 43 protein n=1 Tax=Paenibacillus alkalitolerans TaxID=2799335 RepID=UPI0018F5D99D|nr:glycoside hydrolase family 43 protein [Paenibacillus alkalitolerans]
MTVHEEYAGYLFVYFTDKGDSGEEVYFALSKGNDALHWQELNGGEPVLVSRLGEKGLRDPFITRSPGGDKFYLIGTDLKVHGIGGWDRAVTKGSRSIMVWESADLIDWSDQRMVEIAPPDAGCAWAPEVFYDTSSEQYIVFWASTLPGKEQESYHRMLYAKTNDFVTFTSPEIFMDYGYSVIDTTIIEHRGKIYRFSKGRNVIQEAGNSFFDANFAIINENIEEKFMTRGEGPIVFKSNTEEKWYLFIDEFGLRGYLPLETTDLDSGVWTMPKHYSLPPKPRHGTVMPVTSSEYDRLMEKYGNK